MFPKKSTLKYKRKIPDNVKGRPYTDNVKPITIEINKLLTKKFSQFDKMKVSMACTEKSEGF